MARWSKKRVGAGVAVGAVLAGCLVAARVIFSGADRDPARLAGVSASSPTDPPSAAPNADGARQAISSAEVMSVEGIDVDRVAKRTGAFQSMLDSLRYYAGRDRDPVVNTNRLDLASFAEGKTERELLDFAREVWHTSPYASLQVLTHLLATSSDESVLIGTAGALAQSEQHAWSEDDWEWALAAFAKLHLFYADERLARSMTSEERWWMLNWLQSYRMRFGLTSSEETMKLSKFMRAHAGSEFDHGWADYYEAIALFRLGDPSEQGVRNFMDTLRRMDARYPHLIRSQKDYVDRWRPFFNDEEYVRARLQGVANEHARFPHGDPAAQILKENLLAAWDRIEQGQNFSKPRASEWVNRWAEQDESYANDLVHLIGLRSGVSREGW